MTNSEILQLGQLVANLFAIIVAAGAANLAWRVGKKQNEINENLYNLNLIPSLEIIF